MNHQTFDSVVSELLMDAREMMRTKGEMYAPGEDRLEAFARMAAGRRTTEKLVNLGLVDKHYTAMWMFAEREADTGDLIDPVEWKEKIVDMIVYMCLLWAQVIEDRYRESKYCVENQLQMGWPLPVPAGLMESLFEAIPTIFQDSDMAFVKGMTQGMAQVAGAFSPPPRVIHLGPLEREDKTPSDVEPKKAVLGSDEGSRPDVLYREGGGHD